MFSRNVLRNFMACGRNKCENSLRNFSLSVVAQRQQENQETQTDKLTTISIDERTKIATLTMNRLPVNALSLELMTAVKDSMLELEKQRVSGIILASASSKVYSAGLDLSEVYKPDMERLVAFWGSLQDMWKAVFGSAIPTAALISGHALAGGCMLATCCDYRVILPKLTIGLNETRAGVTVPKWVIDSYVNVMPSRRIAEADVIEGKVYKSEDALKVGLVDAVAPTKEEALQKCLEFFKSYKGVNPTAAGMTKSLFRSDIMKDFERAREKDLQRFLDGILCEEVQNHVGTYLKGLREKTVNNKL